jgi:hypothetical protein
MAFAKLHWIVVITAISDKNDFSQSIHYFDRPERPDIYECCVFDNFMTQLSFTPDALYASYYNPITGQADLLSCTPTLFQQG